jgi:hypothetical protein
MKTERPTVHLVTFATPRFYHRQFLLGLSARVNGVVDTVTAWSPRKLLDAGFQKKVPDISLHERGAGFWSWKPFIIQKRLEEVSDGEIVLYCDVGRIYPFKQLDQHLDPYLRWMENHGQDIMPGIEVPWNGPVSQWTKRDALVALDMDRDRILHSSPIQASFSIWRSGPSARQFVSQWMDLCAQRRLVSDDPSPCGLNEHTGFREHRHDQALLTLLCMKHGLRAITIGAEKPLYDEKHPSEVLKIKWPDKINRTQSFSGMALRTASQVMSLIEKPFRGRK